MTAARNGDVLTTLALVCRHLDRPDRDTDVVNALRDRVLDWALDEGWQVEQWGLRQARRRTALGGSFRTCGPRLPGVASWPRPLLHVLAWLTHLAILVGGRRPAIVVCHTPLLGVGVAVGRALGRARLVVRVVGRTATSAEHLRGQRRRARLIDAVEGFVLRRADLVLAVSKFTIDFATRSGVEDKRIVWLPAYSGGARPPPGLKPEGPVVILYGGRLIPEKGVDTLIRAFATLPTGAVLEIAGRGPEAERLQALARTLGVAEAVRFRGRVPFDEMLRLIDRSHIAVVPTRVEEGLPRFLVEAAHAQCALVGTDLGGTRDVVRPDETGFLVAPDDPEQLGTVLQRLAADRGARERIGKAARQRALTLERIKDEGLQRYRLFCEDTARGGRHG